jgi:hypothetical protein
VAAASSRVFRDEAGTDPLTLNPNILALSLDTTLSN